MLFGKRWREKSRIFGGIRNPKKRVYYVILAGVELEYAWYSPSVSRCFAFLEELYLNQNTEIITFDFTRGGEKRNMI